MRHSLATYSSLIILCLAVSSCVAVRTNENLADYQDEVTRLNLALVADAQNTEAKRDLGAIYMRTGHPVEANRYLQEAYTGGDRSPKLQFFLGLASESLGKKQTALRLYEGYADLPRLNPYRRLMAGRYAVLLREAAHEEVRRRLSEEATISDTEISSSLLAIFAMRYQGNDERYEPLGRGLAEMLTVDLQNVQQLRIVERVRLQALMDELQLAQGPGFDASSSPRTGRLLRAGQVVGGTYYVLPDNSLRLDAAVYASTSPEPRFLPSRTEGIDEFFRVEKSLVFDLLEALNIEPTEAEIERIQHVPTRNLQAFLAFSRGLLNEDKGDFKGAAAFFSRALQLDPQFSTATSKSDRASGMESAATSDEMLREAIELEPIQADVLNPLDDRLDNLGLGVHSSILSRPDKRKPVVQSGIDISTDLRDPPQPPKQN